MRLDEVGEELGQEQADALSLMSSGELIYAPQDTDECIRAAPARAS